MHDGNLAGEAAERPEVGTAGQQPRSAACKRFGLHPGALEKLKGRFEEVQGLLHQSSLAQRKGGKTRMCVELPYDKWGGSEIKPMALPMLHETIIHDSRMSYISFDTPTP